MKPNTKLLLAGLAGSALLMAVAARPAEEASDEVLIVADAVGDDGTDWSEIARTLSAYDRLRNLRMSGDGPTRQVTFQFKGASMASPGRTMLQLGDVSILVKKVYGPGSSEFLRYETGSSPA